MQILLVLIFIVGSFFARSLHKQALAEAQPNLAIKSYIMDSISNMTLILFVLWPSDSSLLLSVLAIVCLLLTMGNARLTLRQDIAKKLLDSIAAKKAWLCVLAINFLTALIIADSFVQLFTTTK